MAETLRFLLDFTSRMRGHSDLWDDFLILKEFHEAVRIKQTPPKSLHSFSDVRTTPKMKRSAAPSADSEHE